MICNQENIIILFILRMCVAPRARVWICVTTFTLKRQCYKKKNNLNPTNNSLSLFLYLLPSPFLSISLPSRLSPLPTSLPPSPFSNLTLSLPTPIPPSFPLHVCLPPSLSMPPFLLPPPPTSLSNPLSPSPPPPSFTQVT